MEIKETPHHISEMSQKNEHLKVEAARGGEFLKLVERLGDVPETIADMSIGAAASAPPPPDITSINDGIASFYWQSLKSASRQASDEEGEAYKKQKKLPRKKKKRRSQ